MVKQGDSGCYHISKKAANSFAAEIVWIDQQVVRLGPVAATVRTEKDLFSDGRY